MGWASFLLRKLKDVLGRLGPTGIVIAVGIVIGTGLYYYFNRPQGEDPHEYFRAEEVECAICRGEFLLSQQVVLLRCRHSFHVACIRRWFRETPTCPICREDYSD